MIELDLRRDGRFLVYGALDSEGRYVVRGSGIRFHLDVACRNDRLVGDYAWLREGDALFLTLAREGDPCGDRSWLFQLRPWIWIGESL